MKDSPLKNRFEKAQAAFTRRLNELRGDEFLSALQDALTVLQEQDMRVSMDVRPRLQGSTHAMQGREALANATVTVDGFEMQWVFSKSNNYASVELAGFVGDARVASFTSNYTAHNDRWTQPELINAATLKDAIINVLVDNLASREAVTQYNIGSGRLPIKPLRQLKP